MKHDSFQRSRNWFMLLLLLAFCQACKKDYEIQKPHQSNPSLLPNSGRDNLWPAVGTNRTRELAIE